MLQYKVGGETLLFFNTHTHIFKEIIRQTPPHTYIYALMTPSLASYVNAVALTATPTN
jgi:hypothetical protein